MIVPYKRQPTLEEIIYLGVIVLLGEQDVDWILHERDIESWQLISWLRRN